ncbi:MAG: hypothetical protein BGO55_20445 [Sphingobacteriales bacterium 50-39]|nr:hypothetical protein [Sphingobacteriales bacterium]OJW59062.1 MAG: hypothetical protein BGO55_20445 [Sphingobacteriales bacterium 50-39]
MERRIKYGRTLVLLLIAGLLLYRYFYSGAETPFRAHTTSIPVSAADLIRLSDKNEALFNQEYLYKVLSVRGIIRNVKKNRNGVIVLLEGQHTLSEVVSCSLDTLYTPHPELQPGDSCIIRGNCAGRLRDIILLQCIVEK